MHEQPDNRACSNPAIGGNHNGPVIIYMASVADATTADGSDPWFKVAEYGYDADAGWGTDYLNDNCGRFPFTGMLFISSLRDKIMVIDSYSPLESSFGRLFDSC